MAALASIRNPQKPEETLIFYTTDQYQVGYEPIAEKSLDSLAGGDEEAGRGAPPDDEGEALPTLGGSGSRGGGATEQPGGLVKHPGAFVAVAFQDLIKVYGITKQNVICELSPGVRNLTRKITTTRSALAGCGNGKDWACLYYLSNAEVPEIKQYVLSTNASVNVQGPPTPDPESTLCAWYKDLDTSRGVVYQNNGNTNLKYWEVRKDGQQTNGEVTNTSQAAKKTPLATCVKGDTTYLYFVTQDNALARSERVGTGQWTNQKVDKDNDWNLNPLTATLSLNGQYIIVRQQYTDSSGYFQWPDSRDIAK